jgi:two-component system alkaline phosphatase synthesis response regulator PhoP
MSRPLICVVEDYADSRVLITTVLSRAGMDVITAEDGRALDALLEAGHEPCLFLIDLSLPGEDGISILRRLRSQDRFKGTPMVALTAHAMAGDAERGRAAGFDDYVTKPIDIATLPTRVGAFLNEAA